MLSQALLLFVLQERWLRYRWAMSADVQMDGAEFERRLLRLMQSDPVGGKYSPFVLSVEGTQSDSEAELEQLVESNTHRSLAQTLSVLVVLQLRVSRFKLAIATFGFASVKTLESASSQIPRAYWFIAFIQPRILVVEAVRSTYCTSPTVCMLMYFWVFQKRSDTVFISFETENFQRIFPSPKKQTSRQRLSLLSSPALFFEEKLEKDVELLMTVQKQSQKQQLTPPTTSIMNSTPTTAKQVSPKRTQPPFTILVHFSKSKICVDSIPKTEIRLASRMSPKIASIAQMPQSVAQAIYLLENWATPS